MDDEPICPRLDFRIEEIAIIEGVFKSNQKAILLMEIVLKTEYISPIAVHFAFFKAKYGLRPRHGICHNIPILLKLFFREFHIFTLTYPVTLWKLIWFLCLHCSKARLVNPYYVVHLNYLWVAARFEQTLQRPNHALFSQAGINSNCARR